MGSMKGTVFNQSIIFAEDGQAHRYVGPFFGFKAKVRFDGLSTINAGLWAVNVEKTCEACEETPKGCVCAGVDAFFEKAKSA
jgi:hypothetical protein